MTTAFETVSRDEHRSEYQKDNKYSSENALPVARGGYDSKWRDRARSREMATMAELNVGRGPSDAAGCGPIRIKSEALERIRAREAAKARDS